MSSSSDKQSCTDVNYTKSNLFHGVCFCMVISNCLIERTGYEDHDWHQAYLLKISISSEFHMSIELFVTI